MQTRPELITVYPDGTTYVVYLAYSWQTIAGLDPFQRAIGPNYTLAWCGRNVRVCG